MRQSSIVLPEQQHMYSKHIPFAGVIPFDSIAQIPPVFLSFPLSASEDIKICIEKFMAISNCVKAAILLHFTKNLSDTKGPTEFSHLISN